MKEAYHSLQAALAGLYDTRESKNITDLVIEALTGWERSKRIVHQDHVLDEDQLQRFKSYTASLLLGKPLQYVLGYTWFSGMRFAVDERVLIPRPETEDLVEAIKQEYQHHHPNKDRVVNALDIGTGSGCIAISVKKLFPHWDVWGLDKSSGALELAEQNAKTLECTITFTQEDILQVEEPSKLPVFDVLVSNPPYIPLEDAKEMHDNVVKHEPHLALFVQNNDPLQFYTAILGFSNHHLRRGGMLFFETHELHANAVAEQMEAYGFEEVVVKKDMQGKDRIVHGKKTGSSL